MFPSTIFFLLWVQMVVRQNGLLWRANPNCLDCATSLVPIHLLLLFFFSPSSSCPHCQQFVGPEPGLYTLPQVTDIKTSRPVITVCSLSCSLFYFEHSFMHTGPHLSNLHRFRCIRIVSHQDPLEGLLKRAHLEFSSLQMRGHGKRGGRKHASFGWLFGLMTEKQS